MNATSVLEISALIFVTMGPIKPLVTFAKKSVDLDSRLRRRIALKAVAVATVVGLIFVFLGPILMELFKFSTTAMSLAGGLILLIYGIRTVLAEGKHSSTYATDREAEEMAIYPLTVPLMASPMGLVTVTIVAANASVSDFDVLVMAGMLLVVMAINAGHADNHQCAGRTGCCQAAEKVSFISKSSKWSAPSRMHWH